MVAVVELAGAEPQVLLIEDTIRLALGQNLTLQRSALSVERQENELHLAQGDRQPNLNFSVSGTQSVVPDATGLNNLGQRELARDGIFDNGGAVFRESLNASLSSSITLLDGGRIHASITGARHELEAAKLDFDRSREALLLSAIEAHLNVVQREKQVSIRAEELANRREELERIELNAENGLRTQAEVLRQRSLVAASERGLIEARRQASLALLNLQNLLRLPADQTYQCADPSASWGTAEELPPIDLPASRQSLFKRVDLEAQRARIASANENIRQAAAGRRATLTASARLSSGARDNASDAVANQFLRTEPTASASLTLNVPIFDRRRTETSVLRAQIGKRQEALTLEILELNAQTAFERALLDHASAQASLRAAREELSSSEAALEAEQARYEAGVATLLDVNSLRAARLDAAVAVEQARFDLFVSRLSVAFEDGSIETFLLDRLPQITELQ